MNFLIDGYSTLIAVWLLISLFEDRLIAIKFKDFIPLIGLVF